jgi:hypothetical protein
MRHGDPLGGRTPEGEPLRWIHEVAMQHTGEACLAWPFAKTGGYGHVKVKGKIARAHRYICELAHGAPPTPEHEAAHSCGKGHEGCVSQGHLEWKTHAENMADRLIHGTHNRGERCVSSKITEAEAREILALKGIESRSRLAARFGVAKSTIAGIHSRHTWAWLSEEAAA